MEFLILAIACNSMESIVVRFSEQNLHNRQAVTMVNYLVTTVISFFWIRQPMFTWGPAYTFTLLLGIFNGCLFIVWLTLFQLSVRNNGAGLSATFTKLGILLPTIGSIAFLGEQPGLLQVCGIVIALAALVLFNLPSQSFRGSVCSGFSPGNAKWLLLLILVIGGLADFNSKIFESFGDPEQDGLFLFCTFAVSFILSVIRFMNTDRKLSVSDLKYGILIGMPNQLTTMFLLWAVMRLPASIVFPLYSVAVIFVVTIIDRFLFKTHFSQRQWFSMALVCIALVCLNL